MKIFSVHFFPEIMGAVKEKQKQGNHRYFLNLIPCFHFEKEKTERKEGYQTGPKSTKELWGKKSKQLTIIRTMK